MIERVGVYEVVFEYTTEYLVENGLTLQQQVDERCLWLKSQNIPFKLTLKQARDIITAKFAFEEFRGDDHPEGHVVNLKAKEQAALFKLFWK